MKDQLQSSRNRLLKNGIISRLLLFLTVFGPATITAMADNDAGGVATYSIAGAKLGYPILFILPIITVLLGVTQEMGMRLTVITRKGLADQIREKYGVKISMLIFASLLVANMGTIFTELSAVKTTSAMLGIPPIPAVIFIVVISFIFITRGNYKLTQSIMLVACLFFLTYIFAAIKARPDWRLALSNLIYPHGVEFTPSYLKNYLIIGMGVLGTTITPWGQFFISSFAFDKKIEKGNVNYAKVETYWGAFLTDFFSFFMIVATAATLYYNNVNLVSGEQAALAIKPFAGELAAIFFAVGILNAGFMGLVIVSLTTAYAFSEFFGLSGSLNDSYHQSKGFYLLFIIQLAIATIVTMFPGVSLFQLAVATQALNAFTLPLVFFFLIKITSDKALMGEHANNRFQFWFTSLSAVAIFVASVFTLIVAF